MIRPGFEVVKSGAHIEAFWHVSSNTLFGPYAVGKALEGGERLKMHGDEYDLTERGNLIAAGVAMPKRLTIGYGVIVGPDVAFSDAESGDSETVIGSQSTLAGESRHRLRIGADVSIGKRTLLTANKVGDSTRIGDDCTIVGGSFIGDGVIIEEEVQIGQSVSVGDNCRIGHHALLSVGARLDDNVRVGDHARVGFDTRVMGGVRIPAGHTTAHGVTLIQGDPAETSLIGV